MTPTAETGKSLEGWARIVRESDGISRTTRTIGLIDWALEGANKGATLRCEPATARCGWHRMSDTANSLHRRQGDRRETGSLRAK